MDLPSTNTFAMGAGLIQVNDFDDPGTMSASHIDYLIADPTLIPKDHQQHYLDLPARHPYGQRFKTRDRR
jgi:predicted O-linked N-acetylglucosamine transferase (SPINDLY family)